MSAYIVHDKTINRVIGFLEADYRRDYEYPKREILEAARVDANDEEWTAKLGVSMALLNDAGVNARYGEGTASGDRNGNTYEWRREVAVTSMQAVKSLQCFLYQCHEGDVPECPLYKALRELEFCILARIVSDLPAYDSAEWA